MADEASKYIPNIIVILNLSSSSHPFHIYIDLKDIQENIFEYFLKNIEFTMQNKTRFKLTPQTLPHLALS